MRAAILTNDLNSFYKPLAEGLSRMLLQLGVKAEVMYEGLDLLDYAYSPKPFTGDPLRFVSANVRRFRKKGRQDAFLEHLKTFDLVVVVANNPFAFIKDRLSGIERLRSMQPELPIVQYNYSYLPVAGKGGLYQEYFGQGFGIKAFGMERYDHYLMVTASTPQPLPAGKQPLSVIGMHFDDGSLYPEQEEFVALLDFPREGKEAERAVVLNALERTRTKFIELSGSYSIPEIRAIYRKSSAYFVAFLESFGFPICELQACGSLIFSPYESWLYSQSIKEDLARPGLGSFNENIRIYGNEPGKLEDALILAQSTHNPQSVRETFLSSQGSLFRGGLPELEHFVRSLREKSITGQSHKGNASINDMIDPKDYCPPPY